MSVDAATVKRIGRLARIRIADKEVEDDRRARRRRTLTTRRVLDAVDVLGDGRHIRLRKSQCRHRGLSGRLLAVAYEGIDELAVLIVQRNLRPEQVRPAGVAAAQVRAMAGAAVDLVERLAALDRELRDGGRAPGDPNADLEAAARQLLAGELLVEEGVLRELVREADAHLEEAVVQRAELEGQAAVPEGRLADAEARHAVHERLSVTAKA